MTEQENSTTVNPPLTRQDTLSAIAELLKTKRMDSNISIHDIERALNIRLSFLKSFESGDWKDMPDDVYALGFLRQYAQYLKCDISTHIQQLKSNDYTLSKPITFPDPPIAPNRKWMFVALLSFLVMFVAFNIFKQRTTPLPSEILQNHGNKIAQNTSSSPNESEQIVSEDSSLSDVSDEADASSEVVEAPLEPYTEAAQTVTEPIALTSEESNADPIDTTPPSETSSNSHHYVFLAKTADVWLQVLNNATPPKILRQALLKKGDAITIDSQEQLTLTCGNPLALEISIDDKITVEAGKLAKKNRILRHYIVEQPAH